MRLEGKVAVVTGSSRGIGREIAMAMAIEGARTVINYSRSEEAAIDTVNEIKRLGGTALAVKASVTERSQVEYLIGNTVENFGQLDILVNNAGGFPIKPFAAVTDGEWDEVMSLDLKSVFLCSQIALSTMRSRRRGTIINMASVAGTLGGFGQASYSTTKAGIIGFTKSIALEGARYGITCNAIVGGLLTTDISKNMPDKMRDRLLRRVPMGKMGDPEDVANAIAFLASDRAKYITGIALNVTGGLELFAF